MSNKLCISKFHYMNENNGNLILKNILQDISSNNFDYNILTNNKNIIINESFITFIITNNKIQKNTDNYIIDLGNCEEILKDKYNTEELVIFTIDINKKDDEIKKTRYEIYSKIDGNIMQKIDLNLCKDVIVNSNKLLDNNPIIKCSDYSIDSIFENSCITCAEFFYPKYEDFLKNEEFIKCYQSINGFYLYENQYSNYYNSLTCIN